MATLFVFGAGASTYCGENTVVPYSPPLGKDLFDDLSKYILESSFPDSLKAHYRNIPAALQEKFRKDFEQGMEALYEQEKRVPLEFMQGMASYFLRFSLDHGASNQNLYVLLLRNLQRKNKHAVFASLNYEFLLEEAAWLSGIPDTCYNLQKTTPLYRLINLIKPHGAANFLPATDSNIRGLTIINCEGEAIVCPIKPRTKNEAIQLVQQGINDNNAVKIPAMSRYMPGKKVDVGSKFVVEQRQFFACVTNNATRILVVGVRVNELDEHIWKPLAETKAILGYVDPNPENFLHWAQEKRFGKKSKVIAAKFSDCFEGEAFSKEMWEFININN